MSLDAFLAGLTDRCASCGFHVPTMSHARDGAPVAPSALRDQALTAVSEAAGPHVKAALEAAIRRHAATGEVFSMNTLRGEVDVTGPVVGSVFGHLSKLGVIKPVGFEPSTKGNTKAHHLRTWIGVAA